MVCPVTSGGKRDVDLGELQTLDDAVFPGD